MKTPRTDAYFAEFAQATGSAGGYQVVEFGDSPELIDELSALVVAGTKRATASLLRDYEIEGEPVPEVGDHFVTVDGAGNPLCVCRTTDIRIGPLSSVDDAFAWDEGEGDRSRDYWLKAHRNFFTRDSARNNLSFHDDILTVFERFTVVWPPELADS